MLTFYEVGSPACYSETYCDLSFEMEKSFHVYFPNRKPLLREAETPEVSVAEEMKEGGNLLIAKVTIIPYLFLWAGPETGMPWGPTSVDSYICTG